MTETQTEKAITLDEIPSKLEIDEQERKKREERKKRFGIDDNAAMVIERPKYARNKNYFKHIDPDEIKPLKDKEEFKLNLPEGGEFDKKKLVLFGVNLMSTEDVEDYFDESNFKVKKIYWLNDYTCIVELDNEEQCIEAFTSLTKYNLDGTKTNFENFNWKDAKSYLINDREQSIQIRIADKSDIFKKSGREDSVFYKFYNRRRGKNDYYKKEKRERSRDRNMQ